MPELLIDPDGILKFDLTHDLNGGDMSTLKEMLIAHLGQGALTICNEYFETLDEPP